MSVVQVLLIGVKVVGMIQPPPNVVQSANNVDVSSYAKVTDWETEHLIKILISKLPFISQ